MHGVCAGREDLLIVLFHGLFECTRSSSSSRRRSGTLVVVENVLVILVAKFAMVNGPVVVGGRFD